jgi:hypothetical protein
MKTAIGKINEQSKIADNRDGSLLHGIAEEWQKDLDKIIELEKKNKLIKEKVEELQTRILVLEGTPISVSTYYSNN